MMDPDEIVLTKVLNGWHVTVIEEGEDVSQFVVIHDSGEPVASDCQNLWDHVPTFIEALDD